MSSQSIKELNLETYYKKAENKLISLSDDYFYYNKLRVGKDANRSEVQFYMQNYRFLNTGECELNNFIEDKIKKLDVAKPKRKAPKEKTKEKKVEIVIEKSCTWGSNNW
jgi:hypothetical protein